MQMASAKKLRELLVLKGRSKERISLCTSRQNTEDIDERRILLMASENYAEERVIPSVPASRFFFAFEDVRSAGRTPSRRFFITQ